MADKVAAAWSRGRNADIADYRAEKDVRAAHLEGECVHFLFSLGEGRCDSLEILKLAARAITHFGWGIDMAVGDARLITEEQAAELGGVRWDPSPAGGIPLRTTRPGTLDDLLRKHTEFLGRVSDEGFRPVSPLRAFDRVHYRRQDQPPGRPFRVFDLCTSDGSRFRYPHRRLIHIAGMVRHLAIEAMRDKRNWPPDVAGDDWCERFVAGHAAQSEEHRQLSFLPLPSLGTEHTDHRSTRSRARSPSGQAGIAASDCSPQLPNERRHFSFFDNLGTPWKGV